MDNQHHHSPMQFTMDTIIIHHQLSNISNTTNENIDYNNRMIDDSNNSLSSISHHSPSLTSDNNTIKTETDSPNTILLNDTYIKCNNNTNNTNKLKPFKRAQSIIESSFTLATPMECHPSITAFKLQSSIHNDNNGLETI